MQQSIFSPLIMLCAKLTNDDFSSTFSDCFSRCWECLWDDCLSTLHAVAGLKGHLPAAQLQGSLAVAILNLKPAKLAGMPSEAMLLAADAPREGGGELVRTLVPPGTCILYPFLHKLTCIYKPKQTTMHLGHWHLLKID